MLHTTRATPAPTLASGGPARSRPSQSLMTNAARAGSAAVVLLWSLGAEAQLCPSNYSTCDNGGCCLSSEQCCPSFEDGCCGSATPYCCGDGTCAATPSQCGSVTRADCDGYDVPCGGGCAPAGSDCCDVAGHYCPPESMCTSDTTCVRGAEPGLASQVEVTIDPQSQGGTPRVAPPYADPDTATDRSCSMRAPAPVGVGAGTAWLLLLGSLFARRRRSPQRSKRPPQRSTRGHAHSGGAAPPDGSLSGASSPGC